MESEVVAQTLRFYLGIGMFKVKVENKRNNDDDKRDDVCHVRAGGIGDRGVNGLGGMLQSRLVNSIARGTSAWGAVLEVRRCL